MRYRLLYDAVFIFFLFWTPWVFSAALGFIGLVLFEGFWEVIPAALFIDLAYGADNLKFFNFQFVMTISAVIGYVASSVIRRSLRLPRT